MPYRDPAAWRALLDALPSMVGGFLAGLLHLFVALAGPRPFPPGKIVASVIEAIVACIVGVICGIFLGPLVTHLAGLDAKTSPEAVGGVKVLVAFLGWKLLPVLRDKVAEAVPQLIAHIVEAFGGLLGRKPGA